MNITKRGESHDFKVVKIEGSKVSLREVSSMEELVVSMYQLKHFGHLTPGMVIHAFCHADYAGEDRIIIYPDRNYSQPVEKIIEENVRLQVLENLPEFDIETLERIAKVICTGGNPEELASAAGVTVWRNESLTLEYKEGLNLDAITEAICSFFNSKGGIIVAGVSDSLETVGLEGNGLKEDDMRRRIINHVRQQTSGALLLDKIKIRFGSVQHHTICLIEVPEHQGNEVAYYRNQLVVRFDCTTHRLEGEEHTQWIIQRYKNTCMQTNNSLAV